MLKKKLNKINLYAVRVYYCYEGACMQHMHIYVYIVHAI